VLAHRRLLAGLCAAVAVAAVLRALSPASPPEPIASGPADARGTGSIGSRLAASHPDLTPMPVRLPDAGMAALLETGDRLTLVATSATGEEASSATVARDAAVLSLPRTDDAGGRLVVLGIRPEEANAVAAAAVRAVLTFTWAR
jgi:hypothetical protein